MAEDLPVLLRLEVGVSLRVLGMNDVAEIIQRSIIVCIYRQGRSKR